MDSKTVTLVNIIHQKIELSKQMIKEYSLRLNESKKGDNIDMLMVEVYTSALHKWKTIRTTLEEILDTFYKEIDL